MAESLGRWYIFRNTDEKYLFKINKKYVEEGILPIIINNINGKIQMSSIEYIDSIHENFTITYGKGKKLMCMIDNMIHITQDEYEDILETEKLRQQVEKLSAHVLALMIGNGSLSEKYDGDFP